MNVAELDELFTFVGEKNRVYIVTIVDRVSLDFLSWHAVKDRSEAIVQAMVYEAPAMRTIWTKATLQFLPPLNIDFVYGKEIL